MRKQFTTTIEEQIQNDFKSKCAKEGISMNVILEKMMEAYSKEDIKLRIEQSSSLDIDK